MVAPVVVGNGGPVLRSETTPSGVKSQVYEPTDTPQWQPAVAGNEPGQW